MDLNLFGFTSAQNNHADQFDEALAELFHLFRCGALQGADAVCVCILAWSMFMA